MLIETFIASSAMYAGAKSYKKHQQRKTVGRFLHTDNHTTAAPVLPFISAYDDFKKNAWQKFQEVKRLMRFSAERDEQMQEVALKPEVSTTEKKANQHLIIACTAMGFALAAALLANPLLAIPAMAGNLYISIPMYQAAYASLKEGRIGIYVLSCLVVTILLLTGSYVVFGVAGISYALADKLLNKVKSESRKRVIDVFRQQASSAWIVLDGVELEIPFERLQVGDTIVVNAGGAIPADGTITAGIASIDQQILTGEAQPTEKEVGDAVFASTVVLSGRIYIQVEKAGEDTLVANIGKILNNTANFKASKQLQAEVMADRTVMPTLLVGAVAFPFIGLFGAAAVLNAHFKYRMGIVAPVSILNFLNLMSQHHILVKDGQTLDSLNQVDTIVFDKTGTLTEEQPHVGDIHTCAEYDESEVLSYAAAAEDKQTHPIARAILGAAKARDIRTLRIDEAEYRVGYGLTVALDDELVRVGSFRFMELEDVVIPPSIRAIKASCDHHGYSLVLVAVNTRLIGAIELHATVRPEAKQIIQALRNMRNVTSMYIISGDNEAPTKAMAEDLGIDHYVAETLPEQKADIIEQLQAEGKRVCYVGDGINDAIALKKAHVSVSLRGASTVATDTAQIVLMDASLNPLLPLFNLVQEFDGNMKTNFAMLVIPTILGMGGVLFLHFGLLYTIVLSNLGLLAGLTSATVPLLRRREDLAKPLVEASPSVETALEDRATSAPQAALLTESHETQGEAIPILGERGSKERGGLERF